MSSAPKSFSMVVSNRPGANNFVSNNGGRADLFLSDPVRIPTNTHNHSVKVTKASIWYNFPNITETNNLFSFSYNGATFNLYLPIGLYNVIDINNTISRSLSNLNDPSISSTFIQLQPNYSTSRVMITFEKAGTTFNASEPFSIGSILGIPTPITSAFDGQVLTGINIATINTVNQIYIHSTIAGANGVRIDGDSGQVVASVPISSSPGTQILYQPFIPDVVPINSVSGQSISRISTWITDENNNILNTFGEKWEVTMLVTYF